jgi:oxygen-independent coproporphyrinogen-3 oxidase
MANPFINKYNVPGPRYTSYPTVPFWDQPTFSEMAWVRNLRRAFSISNDSDGISLCIHLPYCENLCTFCGYNKRITRNHGVEVL